MSAMQRMLTAAILAVAGGTGWFEAHQNWRLREQGQLLMQQQAPLVEQIQQLRHEREEATNKLALLAQELRVKSTQASADEPLREVHRLRDTVEVLRSQLDEANKQVSNEQARHEAAEQLVALEAGTGLIEKMAAHEAIELLGGQDPGANATPSLDDLASLLHVPGTLAKVNPETGLRDEKMKQYWPYLRFKAECQAVLQAVGK